MNKILPSWILPYETKFPSMPRFVTHKTAFPQNKVELANAVNPKTMQLKITCLG